MRMQRYRSGIRGALALILSLLAGAVVAGSDLAREQRLADEIVDSILDGDPLDLMAGSHEFLAIYTETEVEKPRGAVILLHGRGFHPDWAQVAQPLRVGLVEAGWHTLSLQMPVLNKEAKFYDYVSIFPESYPRIEAALDHLHQQGINNIVLLAHSCGTHMAMGWFEKFGDQRISAFVGIGMGATDYRQPMEKPFPLDRLSVPILDLYGGEDYPAVHRLAMERSVAADKAGHPKSLQRIVPGADHYFIDKDDELLNAVSAWLTTL
ncbi:MAG TPA: DUF3530 family protein [Chromatiaceae bacterium]|jgi:pimeloyl-ACP methyl ester carboxylesterase|nr:DUF3530 family protein [Chromatiaceae bacterium]HIB84061.1 DUF3530 family protein [Chromatiaceae bacterium]HIN81867.1 DUF3530 family protein [Chromatiales bacterium]HIO54311.1 DUF3530 family protein [Chromatiales bacterium]